MAEPPLFVTVGAVTGDGDEFAPENVSDFNPKYVGSMFPKPSSAVIVRLCVVPAVCEEDPVITRWVAAPAMTSNGPLIPGVRGSPPVAVAVSLAPVCAVLSVSPEITTVFVPAVIEPVTVPLRGPVPVLSVSINVVVTTTEAGVLVPSTELTVTLKGAPAVGFGPSWKDKAIAG